MTSAPSSWSAARSSGSMGCTSTYSEQWEVDGASQSTMVKQTGGSSGKRVALVLGGGGMKGFAHIGVLRALEERKIKPSIYAGTSIGALIAAAAVGRMPVSEMARRAESLRRRDLFRINHFGMLLERMRSPSIYLEEPLRDLCAAVVPAGTFE